MAEESSGSKFVLRIEVDGKDGQAVIDGFVKKFGTIVEAAQKISSDNVKALNKSKDSANLFAKSLDNINRRLKNIEVTTRFMALHQMFEMLKGMSVNAASVVLGMMKEVSSIEDAQLRLQRQGNMTLERSRQVIQNVRGLVQYTPFMQDELIGLTEALVQGKVALENWKDASGNVKTLNSEFARGVSKADAVTRQFAGNMKVSALSTLADFAALTGNVGEKMPFFVRGMQRAFATGSGILLLDQLNAEARKVLFGSAGAKLKGTAAEAMQRIYKYLQEKGAVGMAAMASATFTGLMSNFKEIPKNFAIAIMGDPTDPDSAYGRIKKGIADLYSSIAKFIDDPEFMGSVKKGLEPIINGFIFGLQKLGSLIEFVGGVVKRNPWIVTLIGGLTVLSSVVAGVATVFLGFIGIMALISTAATALTPILSPVGFLIGGIALALGSTAVAAGYFASKTGTIQKFFADTKLVIEAVIEAIQNWNGETTRVSADTSKKLQESGLLGFFLDVVTGIRKVQLAFEQVYSRVKPVIVDLGNTLSKQFSTISRGFGNMLTDGELIGQSADGGLGPWIGGFATLIEWAVRFTAAIVENIIPAIQSFDMIFTEVLMVASDILYPFVVIFQDLHDIIQAIVADIKLLGTAFQTINPFSDTTEEDLMNAYDKRQKKTLALEKSLKDRSSQFTWAQKLQFGYEDRWVNPTKWSSGDQESRVLADPYAYARERTIERRQVASRLPVPREVRAIEARNAASTKYMTDFTGQPIFKPPEQKVKATVDKIELHPTFKLNIDGRELYAEMMRIDNERRDRNF